MPEQDEDSRWVDIERIWPEFPSEMEEFWAQVLSVRSEDPTPDNSSALTHPNEEDPRPGQDLKEMLRNTQSPWHD